VGEVSVDSVESDHLFGQGDVVQLEGTLFKFKPGLSGNFQERYLQISNRAFRYFKKQT